MSGKVEVPVPLVPAFETEVDVALERVHVAQGELKEAKAVLRGLLERRLRGERFEHRMSRSPGA